MVVKACGPTNTAAPSGDHYVLSVTGDATQATHGFCAVHMSEVSDHKLPVGVGYTIEVDLYNHDPPVGHLGLIYNAKDVNNFDYVYFR